LNIERAGFPYQFEPQTCRTCPGNCCRGQTGYIWVTAEEIERQAAYLGMLPEDFSREYVRRAEGRFSLRERKADGEYLCCFFNPDERRCLVYPVRPSQCRSFPFWESFRADPAEVLEECPGVRLRDEKA
jgi:hypothetical protein